MYKQTPKEIATPLHLKKRMINNPEMKTDIKETEHPKNSGMKIKDW